MDNEAGSAELAAVTAAMGMGTIGATASRIVLASTLHDLSSDPDVQLFSDIDLAILGQPPPAFSAYEKKVRTEYAWAPEATYRGGRSKILRSFLERASIYGTSHFRKKYEASARRNLERSISELAS
jgi:predicted metal-dependent HD superfamily phosphohydrolase